MEKQEHHSYYVRVDSSGRIVLPAELHDALGVAAGDALIVSTDDDGVHLRTWQETLLRAQNYYCGLVPSSVSMSEELIEERRAEARRE